MPAPTNPHRKPIRLPGYDYSQPGAYFITLVTHNRVPLFGNIVGEDMRLSPWGEIAHSEWKRLPSRFPGLELGEFIIMPNHLHGILCFPEAQQRRLGTILGSYKSATTRMINYLRRTPTEPLWQRSYYDHILRNHQEWENIHNYIQNNPTNWQEDEENPGPS